MLNTLMDLGGGGGKWVGHNDESLYRIVFQRKVEGERERERRRAALMPGQPRRRKRHGRTEPVSFRGG